MLCRNVFKCQMSIILQSNVSGVLLNIACTEQSNYLHSVQLEQVKGRHEVLSTRSRSTQLNWAGSQFSYEGASLQVS